METDEKQEVEVKRGTAKIPLVMRPGCGWSHLGSSVWEHSNGVRVHCGFPLVRFSEGCDSMSVHQIQDGERLFHKLLKISGGNRKRAVMAWGLTVAE